MFYLCGNQQAWMLTHALLDDAKLIVSPENITEVRQMKKVAVIAKGIVSALLGEDTRVAADNAREMQTTRIVA
jgi:hypothetical protein